MKIHIREGQMFGSFEIIFIEKREYTKLKIRDEIQAISKKNFKIFLFKISEK